MFTVWEELFDETFFLQSSVNDTGAVSRFFVAPVHGIGCSFVFGDLWDSVDQLAVAFVYARRTASIIIAGDSISLHPNFKVFG
jgi:hypothetical protein